MTNGERIEAKLDTLLEQNAWLVKAVRYLLTVGTDVTAGPDGDWSGIDTADVDGWLDELADEPPDMSQFEHVAVRSAPKVPEPPACPHNQQVLVDGFVRCARCSTVLNATGVRGRHATSPVPAPGHEDQFSHGTRV